MIADLAERPNFGTLLAPYLPLCSVDVGLRFRHAKHRAILADVYRIASIGSDFHEICDECGFHGGTLDLSAASHEFALSLTNGRR